jgi:hypothetical protein
MLTLEQLIAIEEIKQLKARYFYSLDNKEWDAYAAVFTDDAVIDFSAHGDLIAQNSGPSEVIDSDSWVFTGGKALADSVRAGLANTVSAHGGHDPLISITAADEAVGTWPMTDRLESFGELFVGYGYYHEDYRMIDGSWHISGLRMTRLLGIFEPRSVVRVPIAGSPA